MFDQLVLSRSTIGSKAPFRTYIEAAAQAGYDGVGLRPEDRERAHADGLTDADMRHILADNGVTLVEIEYLRMFAMEGLDGERARESESSFFALADALGGRHLTAVSNLAGALEDAAAHLDSLCARAADHGLSIAVEYVPFLDIKDTATAWEVVRLSGASNAGVMVDSWHQFRAGADATPLHIVPPDRITAVQICDGREQLEGTLREDTLGRRVMPGEGVFDLSAFVQELDRMDVAAPLCVEVSDYAADDFIAADLAVRSATAARNVVATARGIDP